MSSSRRPHHTCGGGFHGCRLASPPIALLGLVVAMLVLALGAGSVAAAGAPTVSIFSDPRISFPQRIAAGPDGALWFTNDGNNSIGRITTGGVVTNYIDPGINVPFCDRGGAGWSRLVQQPGRQLDRADHD